MKNILFILSMIISATAFSRPAEELKIRDIRMEKQNQNLAVSFTVEVPRHAVRSKYRQFLVPIVYHKENAAILPGIEVMGRNKARREKQVRLLAGMAEELPAGLIVGEGETVAYTVFVPYADWMDTLSLRVDRMEEGCCKEEALPALALMDGIVLAPKQVLLPVVVPLADTVPEPMAIERRFMVYFRFNRANIDTTFSTNAQILREISDFLKHNPKVRIEISGFASPEGNEAWNEKLAYQRAESLKRYLVERGGVKHDSLAIVHYAINWTGLKDWITESDVPFKTQVLQILDDTTDVELTNRKLQQLQGGIPYRYLLTRGYPELRVVSLLITNF